MLIPSVSTPKDKIIEHLEAVIERQRKEVFDLKEEVQMLKIQLRAMGVSTGDAKWRGKDIRSESFNIGDKVKHKVFGEGTVMEIDGWESVTKLTILFDDIDDRKLIMASVVKLVK